MRIIAGEARSRIIEAPEGRNTRPTLDRVRENLFNILQTRIKGTVVLDLFAGSGALSFEAISRGAVKAVLCDCDRKANRTECKNADALGFSDRCEIFCCDWKTAVKNLKDRKIVFNFVFLDPPYEMTDLREVLESLEPLLDQDGMIIVEHDAKAVLRYHERYVITDERKWGICGMSFLKKAFAGCMKTEADL
ncbi:MAG: 16S rRNA (guanine(966)-N(2))-methyltransferase RsmD [Clostridia bacterium]|nr:16S rRNA (guanine(966)-N(2))-methyltransferase RsmD [Clostridia bacterium]